MNSGSSRRSGGSGRPRRDRTTPTRRQPEEDEAEDERPHERTSLLLGEALVDEEGNVEVPTGPPDEEDGQQRQAVPQLQRQQNNNTTTTDVDNTIASLTRRLRCMFSAVTWPIVPLGTLVVLALVWLLYVAFVVEVSNDCSKPLHEFAFGSFVLVVYSVYHSHVRSYLFRYSRERDGPMRPAGVRLYDQLFHTICILYVYGGVSLIQNCQHDTSEEAMVSVLQKDSTDVTDDLMKVAANTCEATCPVLYRATDLYVTTLELFAVSLILPLLFLPCIYLWILNRASGEAETLAQLQEELNQGRSQPVTVQELVEQMEPVKLVKSGSDVDNIRVEPLNTDTDIDLEAPHISESLTLARECCICMTEFPILTEEADETGTVSYQNGDMPYDVDDPIVRTNCGHLFHRKCLLGWVGGRWDPEMPDTRRARRTQCPLCRHEMKERPSTESSTTSSR